MAKANIEIELSGGEPDGALQRFEPGSRLEGTVRVTPAEDIHSRRVLLRVGWHTADNGNSESGPSQALEQQLAEGPLAANTMVSQPFALDLPREPWSFTGAIVTIVWEASVIIDVPMAPDITLVQPFTLAPRAAAST
jgi:hypothetical protein